MSSRPLRNDEQDQESGRNPILEKVTATLLKTHPSQWKEWGGALDTQARYPKMVDRWEHIFVLEIKAGFLVLRSSTPVLGQFSNGGYSLTPTASSSFYVELREKSWDPRELTDLSRRLASGAGAAPMKKYETLVGGEAAQVLFSRVGEEISRYSAERNQEFDHTATGILQCLEDLIRSGITTPWEKRSEHGNTTTWYRAKVETVRVDVGRQLRKEGATFRLILTNAEGLSRSYENNLAHQLFEALDDSERNAGLLKLNSLLEDFE